MQCINRLALRESCEGTFRIVFNFFIHIANSKSYYLCKQTEMKMKNILSILFLLLAFTACKDPKAVTDVLNRAEAVMNEHPDSALNLLRTLTFDDFQKEKNRARYALLHSQALDKNYIDVTSDSLISVAVEYYKDKDDVRSKFLSYYYMGRVHANGENSLKAMLSFTKAEQLEGEIQDSLALGLLYSQLGDLYREYYDFPKSLDAYKKAEVCYGQVAKERHRLYAMLDQAYVFRNMGQVDECFQKLLEVREEAEYLQNSYLFRSVLGDLLMHYVKENCIEEAEKSFGELKSHFGLGNKTAAFWGCVSRLHATKNNEAGALQALEQGWKLAKIPNDSVILYCDAAKVYAHFKQPEKAYHCVVKATTLQNRLMQESLQQPVLSLRNEYLSGELKNQTEKLRLEKYLRMVSIVLVVVIAIIVVYFLHRMIRKRFLKRLKLRDAIYTQELKRLKDIILDKEHHVLAQVEQLNKAMALHEYTRQKLESLKEEIMQKDESFHWYMEEVDKIQEQQRIRQKELADLSIELLVNRTKLINSLLDCIYMDADNKDAIFQKLTLFAEQLMKEYKSEKRTYIDLERVVNECYDGIMLRIRTEVQLPDEASYRQVCYHLAGFSVKVIALMMGDTPNKIYKRRERIRVKLERMNADINKSLL